MFSEWCRHIPLTVPLNINIPHYSVAVGIPVWPKITCEGSDPEEHSGWAGTAWSGGPSGCGWQVDGDQMAICHTATGVVSEFEPQNSMVYDPWFFIFAIFDIYIYIHIYIYIYIYIYIIYIYFAYHNCHNFGQKNEFWHLHFLDGSECSQPRWARSIWFLRANLTVESRDWLNAFGEPQVIKDDQRWQETSILMGKFGELY